DVGAERQEHVVDAMDLIAIGGVQGEVVKPGRDEVVRRRFTVPVGNRRQDEPLRACDRVAALPCPPIVVAWDLHPPELGEQRVVEALAGRGVTDAQAQVIERAGVAHSADSSFGATCFLRLMTPGRSIAPSTTGWPNPRSTGAWSPATSIFVPLAMMSVTISA